MELRVWRELARLVESRTLTLNILALTCAPLAVSTADAAPAESITFAIGSGAITPPGAVPFDQWITATSSTPVTLAEGEEFAPTAVLEYCEGSWTKCKSSDSLPECADKSQTLPVANSCSLPVLTTPAPDGKGVSVRVDIPPLRYNSAYRLKMSLVGKKEISLTADSLQRVDRRLSSEIGEIAEAGGSPTAEDICRSLVDAINSEFADRNVRIEAPLMSCAEGDWTTDKMEAQADAVEARITDAINSRLAVLDAQQNRKPTEKAERQDEKARQALRGTIREVVSTNTWMPIPLGTAADAVTTRATYISADVGLVYGWDLDESITYLGANIYTRPINSDVSLSSLKAEGMLTWRHRLSFTLGATLGSIDKAGERKGIIGSNALVVGAGCRVTDVLRISAGVMVFKEENPNPLVTDDTSLAVSPYVGFSFDIDVAKQLGKVFSGLP